MLAISKMAPVFSFVVNDAGDCSRTPMCETGPWGPANAGNAFKRFSRIAINPRDCTKRREFLSCLARALSDACIHIYEISSDDFRFASGLRATLLAAASDETREPVEVRLLRTFSGKLCRTFERYVKKR